MHPFALTLLGLLIAPALAQTVPTLPIQLEPIAELTVGGGIAQALAFSPDDRRIATGGDRGDLIVWDRNSATVVWSRAASDHWIGALAWSPDGTRLACMGQTLTVWRADGAPLCERASGGPHGVAFDRDGKRLAFHSGHGVVDVLDTATWQIAASFHAAERHPVNSIAFTGDGTQLVAGDNGGRVWRLDFASGSETVVHTFVPLESGGASVQHVAALPQGLLAASWNGQILAGERRLALHGTLYSCAAAADGSIIAAVGPGGAIARWDAGDAARRFESGATVNRVVLNHSGDRLAASTSDGRVLLFRGDHLEGELAGHSSEVDSVAFSADASCVAASGRHTVFMHLHSGDRHIVPQQMVLTPGAHAAEFLVAHGAAIEVRDGRSGAMLGTAVERVGERSQRLFLAPDGRTALLGGGFSSIARVFDLVQGESTELEGFGRCLDAAWSPDGRLWAVARVSGNHGEVGDVVVRDERGRARYRRACRAAVDTVAFSPDGKRMVYATARGSMYQPVTPELRELGVPSCEQLQAVNADVDWWRYLDDDFALVREPQALSLWNARTLQPIGMLLEPAPRLAALAADHTMLVVSDRTTVRVLRLQRR